MGASKSGNPFASPVTRAVIRNSPYCAPGRIVWLLLSTRSANGNFPGFASCRGTAARELFQRVTKFYEHFERIRDGLEKASKAYNEALGSYESRVRPAGERLLRLGGSETEGALGVIEPLETPLRIPSQAPETAA